MKKKLLKSVSLVALSAVMAGGAAISFAGCGGKNKEFEISVSMFCGNTEVDLNRGICQTWAKEYSQKLRDEGVFEEGQEIEIRFSNNPETEAYFSALQRQMGSGKQPDVFYVSPKYVKNWTKKGNVLDLSPYLTKEEAEGIWEDSLAFYAYSSDSNYSRGDRISYNGSKFVTANGAEVGVYGLPKDYSNFGLGFNEVLINENNTREHLTEWTTQDRTGASGAEKNSAALTYEGESGVVTDVDGKDVPLINIGKPTYYKPYNFYSYASYEEAIAGGDPMACSVNKFTGGKGYLVTIPGFPGDTLKEAAKYWEGDTNTEITATKDPDAQYDTEEGYVTFTYAEYSAFTWALTYYYNTYDWNEDGNGGGVETENGRRNVYGNDQYDGVLYLLPWLAGNDAQYLNKDSTKVINGENATQVGTDTYTTSKITLSGMDNDYKIQYGVNSEAFIETLGAFHAYGSDWNGNSNFAGDTNDTKDSGWDMFCGGNVLFYGVGTWNSGVLNNTSRTYLKYRLMPEPVGEKYALASWIKDADYNMKDYGDSSNGVPSKNSYTGQEIFDNQVERQDKWGARMDSVGYGVSGLITKGASWRAEAAVSLVKYLTVTEDTQVELTYAGSQLPNFKQQCVDFYTADKNGAFGKMITPDDSNWDSVYAIADELFAARQGSDKDMTIEAWINAKHPGTAFNPSFAQDKVSSVTQRGTAMRILYLIAYKKSDRDLSLRMQYGMNAVRDSAMYTFNTGWLSELEPRQKNMVLAYENRVSYQNMDSILSNGILRSNTVDSDIANDVLPEAGQRYATPKWFCLHQAAGSQKQLDDAIKLEG